MDNLTLTESGEVALKGIKKARPKTFVIVGGTILSQAQFKTFRPESAQLHTVGVGSIYDDITPELIAKMEKALAASKAKPRFYVDGDNDMYSAKDVDKAKHVPGIEFEYPAFGTGRLLADGTLTIGCQSHKLSAWASAEPEFMGSGLTGYLYAGDRANDRDALIPVLKEKLKTLKKAAAKK